jgi:hypothetical protein
VNLTKSEQAAITAHQNLRKERQAMQTTATPRDHAGPAQVFAENKRDAVAKLSTYSIAQLEKLNAQLEIWYATSAALGDDWRCDRINNLQDIIGVIIDYRQAKY